MTDIPAVRDIRRTLGSVRAVDGISFTVRRGSSTGLMGRNGAGKTTTIRMITGIFFPDSGRSNGWGRRRRLLPPDSAVRVDVARSGIEVEHGRADSSTYDRLRAVASFAIDKRLPQSACRALLFLRRLGRSTKASHIRHVIDFIGDLDKHPHREFVPPEIAAW